MGKTSEGLAKSRTNRANMLKYFGFIPLSVLNIKRKNIRIIQYQEETGEHAAHKKEHQYSKQFNASCKGSRGGDRYSIMPAALVEFALKYWGTKNSLYLDPFAGQGVQMQVAKNMGVDYIGFDICAKFMKFNRAVAKKINTGKTRIDLHEKDAREIGEESKGWDFCFTSPPYWDIEHYDDNPKQLGVNKDYDVFLEGIKDVYAAMYKQAKSGAVIVININDFRKAGKFYSYHADTIRLLEKAGFNVIDVAVLSGGLVSGIARAFAVDFNLKRILPKVHEYLIIARK